MTRPASSTTDPQEPGDETAGDRSPPPSSLNELLAGFSATAAETESFSMWID